ncbi:MAG: Gfo/Idh/MocA family oxidoreductase [Chloroflexi bacterium]|nr:Gfo/Idh/MocA family oxidoreductase [Chloroflexota bacterium]
MSGKFRVAVVGTGRVGALWETNPPTGETHAGAFFIHPGCELVAGANRGRKRLEEFGQRFGVHALYQDYHEMLQRERPDIVCVATHPSMHADIVEAAVLNGAKGIFCEKPMALDLADCDRIINACKTNGVLLSVNHSRRWDPTFLKAQEIVRQGAIGELVSLYGVCQGAKPSPGWQSEFEGPLLHDATHLFDLMRMFAGDVQWVVATALRRKRTEYPVEDDSSAILHFHSGISAVSLVNELTDYMRFEIEIQGTSGMMLLGYDRFQIAHARLDAFEAAREDAPEIEWQLLDWEDFPRIPAEPAFAIGARELVEALEGKGTITSTGEDGRASMEIIMAIYESQRRGNIPVHLPLPSGSSSLVALAQEQGWSGATRET